MAEEQDEEKKTPAIDLSGLSFGDDLVVAGDTQISWVKLLAYGPSGAGKSSLMATMPEPLLILLTEKQGEMTIRRVNPRAQILHIEDTVVCKCHLKKATRCPTGAKKGSEKLTAKQVLYSALDELATKNHPFISVALDSLTDLQQILLSDLRGGQAGKKVSLPEWGVLIDETKDFIIKIRNLNMHSGVICLSDEVQDSQQRMIYRPQLAGKKLPAAVLQYFNLVCFQRKSRDPNAVGGATYESVFDAGDEYYTKTHPALNPVEVPLVRNVVDKVTAYAVAHGEGEMPSTSSPVTAATAHRKKEDTIKTRLENPEIKALFDQLGAPEAKRRTTAEKYLDDGKLKEILKKRLDEMAAEAAKKAAVADEAKKLATPTEQPSTDAPPAGTNTQPGTNTFTGAGNQATTETPIP